MCLWTVGGEMRDECPFGMPFHAQIPCMPFSPATRALAIVAAAALSNCNAKTPSISTVTFERTPCFGTCPVYKVNVNGNGDVKFEGIRNVDSVGTFSGHIDAAAVAQLSKAFEDAKYFSLQSNYGQGTCTPYAADAQ